MNQINLYKKIYNFMNILTIVSALLLFFCFCYSFDVENSYLNDSPLTLMFFISYGLGAIISLSSVLTQSEFDVVTTHNGIHGRAKSYYTATTVASILTGAIGFFISHESKINQNMLIAAAGLLSFGIFQLMLSSKSGYRPKTFKLIFLFASIAFPVEIVFASISDYSHHINSIENTLMSIFSISFLLYILYEAKRICTGAHSAWHFASMTFTCMSGFVISSAYLFAFLFDIIKDGSHFYPMLAILAASAFIGVELKHFIYTAKTQNSTDWQKQQKEKLLTRQFKAESSESSEITANADAEFHSPTQEKSETTTEE